MDDRSRPRESFALRARWVLPVARAPIFDGFVAVDGDTIVAVGEGPCPSQCVDLGDVALLPGFINAHTHLDLSNTDHPLGRPGMRLVDWFGEVMRHKLEKPADAVCVEKGLRESVRHGTTTIADIAQATPATDVLDSLGVNLVSFLELIAPTSDRIAGEIERAETHLAEVGRDACWQPGLSPHATYTVQPDLLSRAVTLSAEHHVPLAMHVAESPEELELIQYRRGPLRELLERLGAWASEAFAEGLTVLDYLKTLARAHRALVIHGNYLAEQEMAFLAAHADRMAVVYCPRSHAFFGHAPYPLDHMLARGIRVALGTDSRASSPDLSLLAEMRAVRRRHPNVEPETIMRLGTADGAAALGQRHRWGTIEPGRRADLTAVALPNDTGTDKIDPCRTLLESDTPVLGTWCGGRQVFASQSGTP